MNCQMPFSVKICVYITHMRTHAQSTLSLGEGLHSGFVEM